MTNLFEKAKASPVKPTKKPTKPSKARIGVAGIERHAALAVIAASIKTLEETEAASVKDSVLDYFVTEGMAKVRRPENFRGVEGDAETSCELRRRTSRSVLTEDEIEILEAHKIPLEERDVVVEAFIVNPNYTQDMGLLKKVSKALEGIVPDDFFQMQSEKTMVVSDETIDEIFKLKNKDDLEKCLKIATTTALKPTLDPEKALVIVAEALGLKIGK